MNPILITGAAGFIGMHTTQRLLREGHIVVGIDNLNDYYDPALKYARLSELGVDDAQQLPYNVPVKGMPGFTFVRLDLTDKKGLMDLFEKYDFGRVVHLAAQAGVRYSITHPDVYIGANITGFFHILEACRHFPVEHLVFASSSSVYGNSEDVPFQTGQTTDTPISLYAATKKSNEVMAHAYIHLYQIPMTGLRFFTVYGPWGRPDMAYFSFAKAIMAGHPIQLFNFGKLERDFTYVDDVVEGVKRLLSLAPEKRAGEGSVPYRLLNIGNSNPEPLAFFVRCLEEALGKKALLDILPMQPGDVYRTFAETSEIESLTGFKPNTPLMEGLKEFGNWFLEFHKSGGRVF